jgi:hypothetical protein
MRTLFDQHSRAAACWQGARVASELNPTLYWLHVRTSALLRSGHSAGILREAAYGCDFNRSMQHLDSNTGAGGVADGLSDQEIYH